MTTAPARPSTASWRVPLYPTVFATALIILVARLPEAIFRAEFWADDSRLYTHALAGVSLLEPYAATLFVGLRAVAWAETLVPPASAPLVGNGVALLTMAGTAAFATSGRMPWDRRTGLLIAFGIVALPASFQLIGNLSHAFWGLALWMGLTALSREPESRTARLAESAGLIGVGITGVGALLLWPLFVGSRRRLLVVLPFAIIQGVVLFMMMGGANTDEGREALIVVDLEWAGFVVLERVFVTPLLGPDLTSELPMFAIAIFGVLTAGIVAAVLRDWRLAFLGLIAPTLALFGGETQTAAFADPELAPRYFWLSGAVLVIVLAQHRNRPLVLPLILLLMAGVVSESRITPPPEVGWSSRSECIGGPEPCSVPVEPRGRFFVEYVPRH